MSSSRAKGINLVAHRLTTRISTIHTNIMAPYDNVVNVLRSVPSVLVRKRTSGKLSQIMYSRYGRRKTQSRGGFLLLHEIQNSYRHSDRVLSCEANMRSHLVFHPQHSLLLVLAFWRRNYYFFNFSTPCI
jgi:hypothetical protein